MAESSASCYKGEPRPTDGDQAGSPGAEGKRVDSYRLERCASRCEDIKEEAVLPDVEGKERSNRRMAPPMDFPTAGTTKAVFTAQELLLLSRVFPEIKSQLDCLPKISCEKVAGDEEAPEWEVESDSEFEEDDLIEPEWDSVEEGDEEPSKDE